jgi:hypothetical protein
MNWRGNGSAGGIPPVRFDGAILPAVAVLFSETSKRQGIFTNNIL